MKIIPDSIQFTTQGRNEVKDLTGPVGERLARSGLQDGTVTVFVPGSTAGLTTIEFEPGVIEDLSGILEKLVPSDRPYLHDRQWGDGNGFSHVRAALLGPSITVPFNNGRLALGTWQQLVLIDFDNRPRTRTVLLQFIGE
ncbi:MAG: secondary thiamine-phosphate synthase enzyme [Candidatus Aminicenantes bacterium RBG_13_63_10]|nr:MAG: secondary thiamine-phosphate synthase enzyme [Candidatus Aminicenantes bacterium RBG_13_63_10]